MHAFYFCCFHLHFQCLATLSMVRRHSPPLLYISSVLSDKIHDLTLKSTVISRNSQRFPRIPKRFQKFPRFIGIPINPQEFWFVWFCWLRWWGLRGGWVDILEPPVFMCITCWVFYVLCWVILFFSLSLYLSFFVSLLLPLSIH